MKTGNSKPEGPKFQWGTGHAEFPTAMVSPRDGTVPVSTEHNDRFCFLAYSV